MSQFPSISLDSVIELLERFIPDLPSDMRTDFTYVQELLVTKFGYDESTALRLLLFAYARARISGRIEPRLKPSVAQRLVRSLNEL